MQAENAKAPDMEEQNKDEEERSIWMDNHRKSKSLALGEIIEAVYQQREASWEIAEDFKRRDGVRLVPPHKR